jgi:hypothetical protein
MSTFNKQVGKIIDKTKEEKLRSNWKKTKILTQSSFVGADIINQLLSKTGAVGLRIYYGMDDEGNMQPIFFASDDKGNPIVPSKSKTSSVETTNDDSGGADASVPCPPFCATP